LLSECTEEVEEFVGVFEGRQSWGLEPGELVDVMFAPNFESEDSGGEVNAEYFRCVDSGANAV
jgi:hypothetical protein